MARSSGEDAGRWRAFVEAGREAVEAAGEPRFADAVDRWVNAMLPIDSIAVFAFTARFRASHVFTVGRLGPVVGEDLARDYTERFAAADPVWRSPRPRTAAGDRLIRLATDNGYTDTYVDHFFARHALIDKAAIIQAVGPRYLYCNFYRLSSTGRFSLADWQVLPVILPQVASTIALHALRRGAVAEEGAATQVLASGSAGGASATPASYVVQDLNEPSRGPFRNLATREREVCYRTLLGLTADAIARDLLISPSTVVTYRRRAYEKLGITTQKELFGLFLQRARGRPRPT